MRHAAWTAVALVTSAVAAAASPPCCRLFDIDATPILGENPVLCGKIPDADNAQETVDERRRAAQCALAAQSQGRAFVYTYRSLVPPDIDLIVQALFGERGERLLLTVGRFGAQDVRTTEVCTKLNVLPDGKLDRDGCNDAYSFFEQLRVAPW